MTVSNVLGQGRQKGVHEIYRGAREVGGLLRKVRLDIAVNEDFVEPTISAIHKAPRTEGGKLGTARSSSWIWPTASGSAPASGAALPSVTGDGHGAGKNSGVGIWVQRFGRWRRFLKSNVADFERHIIFPPWKGPAGIKVRRPASSAQRGGSDVPGRNTGSISTNTASRTGGNEPIFLQRRRP